MVLPPRGLNDRGQGGFQAEQPQSGKEGIGPALMIGATTSTTAAATFAQDAAQADAEPGVDVVEQTQVGAVLKDASTLPTFLPKDETYT